MQPIPAKIVENFIPLCQDSIWLEDDDGIVHPCMLGGHRRRDNECYLTSGWFDFVKAIGLKPKVVIHFSFPLDP